MSVMTETWRPDIHHQHKPTAILRTIWKRTLSFRKKKLTDRFAAYKGVTDVSIKKGTASLGIMIIEGRHAEVGQGIFISDIQQDSPAEQAGLQIGDMILAVNKDSLLGCSYDTAAATLKRTEGIVILTVCNPNKKDDPTAAGTEGGSGSGAAGTGTGAKAEPIKPPAPVKVEPPADPSTAAILPNKDTVIEINSDKKSLGIILLGGSDTLINGPAAVILEIYPNGTAAKDGRLQPGDQIVECLGVAITKEMTHERVCLTIKRASPKTKMTVYRPDPIPYQDIEVEIAKKSGKGLGLSLMARTPGPGVYIADLIPGTPADLDHRLQRGDLLQSVDGTDVSKADAETAAAACKCAGNKAQIKVKRFKIVR